VTPEQFIFWLQGYFEINGNNPTTDTQIQIIRDKLQTTLNNFRNVNSPQAREIPNSFPTRRDIIGDTIYGGGISVGSGTSGYTVSANSGSTSLSVGR
jgi:hypothetical protein